MSHVSRNRHVRSKRSRLDRMPAGNESGSQRLVQRVKFRRYMLATTPDNTAATPESNGVEFEEHWWYQYAIGSRFKAAALDVVRRAEKSQSQMQIFVGDRPGVPDVVKQTVTQHT